MHIYSTPCFLYDYLPTISECRMPRPWLMPTGLQSCSASVSATVLDWSHYVLRLIFWNNISRFILKTRSVFVYKTTVTISFLYNEWPRGRSSHRDPNTPITVQQRRMPAVFPMSWRFWLLQRTKPRRSWQHSFRRSGGRLFVYLNQIYTFLNTKLVRSTFWMSSSISIFKVFL